MPISYDIDRERALIRTTLTGFVTFTEVIAHFDALEDDPRQSGTLNVLLDLRGLTSVPETGQLRRAAARIDPERSPLQFGACALVAIDPETVATGKLFAVFARQRFRATTIVPTLEDAERWLLDREQPPDGTNVTERR
jgi:hypothetical protein